ncbi:SLAC1 anion channel family protein [Paenibacillus sp. HWE-109]|uniref:SLAC1 anion channel family protein n=1 Tax=Paenibacillus sp. HWE-109 TaxID=1306526 RepID=UPI001EDF35A8|nr:SLAC1 anion channel family protein [Paenibacillus sp. HWE-109]UKS25650.1 SLAC1 anion channel family protein [Paenibacillus sp. HWE-109]
MELTATKQQNIGKIGSIQYLPVNLFAAVMGISGFSSSWRLSHELFHTSAVLADLTAAIAIIVFILLSIGFLVKGIRYPQKVAAEFTHPIVGNFFGTIPIAILLLSSILNPYQKVLSEYVWIIGMILALALSYIVISRLLKGKLDLSHAVPAWLIPCVGVLDIAVTGGTMPFAWAHEVNLMSLAIGGFAALLFLPLIINRLIHHEALGIGLMPSMIILIAPFEVGFLGYSNFLQRIDNFAAVLFYFGLFLFIVLAFKVFKKSVTFGASWWAVSFPMAALSNAALKYAIHVNTWPLKIIAALILLILTIVIIVLLVRTLIHLFNGKLLQG